MPVSGESAGGETPPLDEAGAGGGWLVVVFFLHAAAGVASGRVLLMATLGLAAAEAGGRWIDPPGEAPPRVEPVGRAGRVAAAVASGGELQLAYWSDVVGPLAVAPPSEAATRSVAGGLWRLAVWGLFGGAIARVAAPHFAYAERPTLQQALRRSARAWPAQLAGPAALAAATLLAVAAIWALGWLSRVSWLGAVIALAWPAVGLLAVIAALAAIGLWLGTPLFWSAWAVERVDGFESVSTGLAYVFQRPPRLAAYTLQAWVVGAGLGAGVAAATGVATAFAEAWFLGAGHPWAEFGLAGNETPQGDTKPMPVAVATVWLGLLRSAPLVFHAAYFWFAAVGVFLLMRRDIDEKPCDEVYEEGAAALPVASASASPA